MNKFYALAFGILMPCLSIAQLDLQDSLVAHYKLDGNAADSSGNGYDATNYGATPAEDRFGRANMAYYFDGADDYMNTFSTFDFNYRTLSLWVKSNDNSGTDNNEKHVAGQDASTLSYGQLKVKFTQGQLALRAGGEANNYLTAADTATWYHVVVVRDGNICRYYVDGVLLDSATSGSVGSVTNPNEDFLIGVGRKTTSQFFGGYIDDIRIYSRVLTDNEISTIYNYDPNSGDTNTTDGTSALLKAENIIVSPNPASQSITFSIASSKYLPASVNIVDITGRSVMHFNSSKLQNRINIAHLPSGTYYLKVKTPSGQQVSKQFIKQ